MRPKWYLDDVKSLQNHPWTDREKLAIFSLRDEENMPAQRVAKVFGVTKIQVYNVTRLIRRSKNKECYMCGKPLSKKEITKQKGFLVKACDTCKTEKSDYKRNKRENALKKGLCPYCAKRKLAPGKKGCTKCLSATHRRRYNIGLCGRCGKRPIAENSRAHCKICLRLNAKQAKFNRKLKKLTKDKECKKTGKSSKK